jgi:hypothetical protein
MFLVIDNKDYKPAGDRQLWIINLFKKLSQALDNKRITEMQWLQMIDDNLTSNKKNWLYLSHHEDLNLFSFFEKYGGMKLEMEKICNAKAFWSDILDKVSVSIFYGNSQYGVPSRVAVSSAIDYLVTFGTKGFSTLSIAGEGIGALLTFAILVSVESGLFFYHKDVERFNANVTEHFGGCLGSCIVGTAGGAIGALIGSIFPVIGTLIGAFVGSIVGGLCGDFVCRKITRYFLSKKYTNKKQVCEEDLYKAVEDYAALLEIRDIKTTPKSFAKRNFRELILKVHTDKNSIGKTEEEIAQLNLKSAELILAWNIVSNWYNANNPHEVDADNDSSCYFTFYVKKVRDSAKDSWRAVGIYLRVFSIDEPKSAVVDYEQVTINC